MSKHLTGLYSAYSKQAEPMTILPADV